MTIHQKFIICDDEIIIGHVKFHNELLPQKYEKVCGGGLYEFEEICKEIILFGSSSEFGTCKPEDIQFAITNGLFTMNYEDYIIKYFYYDDIYKYDSNGNLIN